MNESRRKQTVCVIIVNYNSGKRLKACLEALSRQTVPPSKVVVVDNASCDDSIEKAQEAEQEFHLERLSENVGFAAGNNVAAELADSEWIAFLNPDAYPEDTWLEEFWLGAQRYPAADAFGSVQIDAFDRTRLDGDGDCLHAWGVGYRSGFGHPIDVCIQKDTEVFSACAAAAFYRRECFQRLGGFDERYFCYAEDLDLGFRLRLTGGHCIQLHKPVVYHEGSRISGRHSAFTVYHGHRNRIWMQYLCLPFPLFWLLQPLHILVHGMLFVRMLVIGHGADYLRALIDGYSALPSLLSARRAVQQGRVMTFWEVVKVIEWDPRSLVTRRGKRWSVD